MPEAMWSPLWLGLGELLAPTRCAACEVSCEAPGSPFCGGCLPVLEPAPLALLPPQPAAAAYAFQGPLADAIRRFKYGDRPDLGRGLGRLLGQACLPYAGQLDCVVPMPLHPEKLRTRGYNPAALLARGVAATLRLPMDCANLRRLRDTPPQASLAKAARAENVRGAFAARPGTGRVLVIDDVRTTGATASEAARALLEAGYTISSVALAWAPA
jgi:predicted amidophosphoribosyltransferase